MLVDIHELKSRTCQIIISSIRQSQLFAEFSSAQYSVAYFLHVYSLEEDLNKLK